MRRHRKRTVVAVEAPLDGPSIRLIGSTCFQVEVAEVPFASHICGVTCGLERFGDGNAFVIEIALIGGYAEVLVHVSDACLMGIETCQKRGACRAAAGVIIELGEAQAVGGEFVDVRGFNFSAVTADVGKTHIVCEYDDDVGF